MRWEAREIFSASWTLAWILGIAAPDQVRRTHDGLQRVLQIVDRDALYFILQAVGLQQFLVDARKFAGPLMHQGLQFPLPSPQPPQAPADGRRGQDAAGPGQ